MSIGDKNPYWREGIYQWEHKRNSKTDSWYMEVVPNLSGPGVRFRIRRRTIDVRGVMEEYLNVSWRDIDKLLAAVAEIKAWHELFGFMYPETAKEERRNKRYRRAPRKKKKVRRKKKRGGESSS